MKIFLTILCTLAILSSSQVNSAKTGESSTKIQRQRIDDFDYEEVIKYLNGGGGGDMAPLEGGDMPPLEENLVNPLDAEALERMPVKRHGPVWYKTNKRWHICTPHNLSCNFSPNSCCPGTTCICNLWGQNCRCQRIGLLSQWLGR